MTHQTRPPKDVPRNVALMAWLKEGQRFHDVADGEWVQPEPRGYLMQCCDCDLVHRMNFRIRDGRVQFQAFRVCTPVTKAESISDDGFCERCRTVLKYPEGAEHQVTFVSSGER